MKLRRILLIGLYLLGICLPNAAMAVTQIRRQNPCGMLICCCPEMCRRVKQTRWSCMKQDAARCGSTMQREVAAIKQEVEHPRLSTADCSGQPCEPSHGFLTPAQNLIPQLARVPLDRPPTR